MSMAAAALARARRVRLAPLREAVAPRLPGPRGTRLLGAAAAAIAVVAALYMGWLRDSSLVAVEKVTVSGLTGQDAERVRTALESAARQSTTLHVDREAIDDAAAAFPTIRSVDVHADFPHALRIDVNQHRPAALLTGGDKRIPVAGDGSVLSGLPVKGSLPRIELEGTLRGGRLAPGDALTAARIAGAAPAALLPRLEAIARSGRRGMVVRVKDGPELLFGTATALVAKWAAAARVLADREAAGAKYVDVRIPGRPVAGGLPVETVAPIAPASTLGETPPPAAEGDGTGAQEPAAEAGPAQSPESQAAPAEPAQPVAPEAAPTPSGGAGGGAAANPQP